MFVTGKCFIITRALAVTSIALRLLRHAFVLTDPCVTKHHYTAWHYPHSTHLAPHQIYLPSKTNNQCQAQHLHHRHLSNLADCL
jgi:hypothetical protein